MTNVDGQGPGVPAGWYPDAQTGGQRYWDGVQWTEHRAPAPPPMPQGAAAYPALTAAPAATDKPWYQETMWIVGGVIAAILVIGAASGSGSTDEVDEASSSAVPPSAALGVEQDAPTEEQPEPESTAQDKPDKAPQSRRVKKPKVAQTFVMPPTVGMVLQDAQDLLQSKGSYILTQTDAMGWGRFQVLDSGWKVCWQQPAAGTVTSLSFMVDLGVVKLDESCP